MREFHDDFKTREEMAADPCLVCKVVVCNESDPGCRFVKIKRVNTKHHEAHAAGGEALAAYRAEQRLRGAQWRADNPRAKSIHGARYWEKNKVAIAARRKEQKEQK